VAFAIFTADTIRRDDVLDTQRLFTSLSLLILLTQPLFELFAGIMDFISALGCFARVEQYLVAAPRADLRVRRSFSANDEEDLPIQIVDGAFGWSAEGTPVLSGVCLRLARSKLMIVVGPVASGKSTLLKGILGETPMLRGEVALDAGPVAFCDQTAWLAVSTLLDNSSWAKLKRIQNGTIKDNITAHANWDPAFYQVTLKACALEVDLDKLADGDQTNIGSKGLSLSSGQKQRIVRLYSIIDRTSANSHRHLHEQCTHGTSSWSSMTSSVNSTRM
jgi:ABC-type bacteriocin/lantibiotic exporter with double-glycine peptidase domain